MTEQQQPREPRAPLPSVADDPTVQSLYPIMSQVIDEAGGVCRMNTMLDHPDVARIRSQLPKREEYKISKIIADEEQFFTLIENSAYIATATGYENNYVDLEGQLTDAGRQMMIKHKETAAQNRDLDGKGQGKGREGRAPLGREVLANGQHKNPSLGASLGGARNGVNLTLDQRFQACRKQLNDALKNVNADREFDEAVKEARNLRRELKQQGPGQQQNAGRNQQAPIGREQTQRNQGSQLKRPQLDAPRGAPDNKRARNEPVHRQASSKAAPAKQQNFPRGDASQGTPDEKLEKLMRAVVNKLESENPGPKGVCLTHLSTADDIRPFKNWMHPGMRFGEVFSVAYPQIFDTTKDERNQMYVSLKSKPPTGPCPPETQLEIRAERRRGMGSDGLPNASFRQPREGRNAPFEPKA